MRQLYGFLVRLQIFLGFVLFACVLELVAAIFNLVSVIGAD